MRKKFSSPSSLADDRFLFRGMTTGGKSISNIRLDLARLVHTPRPRKPKASTGERRRDGINLFFCLIFTFFFPRLSLRPTKYATKKKIHIFSVLITLLNKINFSLEIHIHPDTSSTLTRFCHTTGHEMRSKSSFIVHPSG